MTVYIIKHLLICDYDVIKNSVDVYKNPIKAKKAFKTLVNKERLDCTNYGWSIDTDDEKYFEAGVDGCSWSEYSECISLEEKELI